MKERTYQMSVQNQNGTIGKSGAQSPDAYAQASFIRRVVEGFSQARKVIFPNPLDVPTDTVRALVDPNRSKEVIAAMNRSGSVYATNKLSSLIAAALTTSYYRRQYYRELENVQAENPLVGGTVELYVDSVTAASSITNRAVWVTANDKKVANELNQMFESVGVEEKIRDWAGQLALFGDFFIELYGRERVGIAYVDDNIHPGEMERIDVNGRLEGFIRTSRYGGQRQFEAQLEAPWRYVHFRTYGIVQKMQNQALGVFGEPALRYSAEFLNASGVGGEKSYITTRYGVSIISPSVNIAKRYKLAMDSLMMARVTRGMLFILYNVKVKGGTYAQASELVNDYMAALKRNTGLNLNTKEWKDAFEPIYAQVEDLYIATTDDIEVTAQELGGKSADIKGVADLDLLTSQLLGALRVSPQMLGIDKEGGITLGEGASRRISVNFAKNAKRLQDGIRAGLKRMAQIHLAYRGMNARPDQFEVHFGEVSTAEEEEVKNALKTGVEIVDDFVSTIDTVSGGNVDKVKLAQYLLGKVIKLDDFVLTDYLKNQPADIVKDVNASVQAIKDSVGMRKAVDTELLSPLPCVGDAAKSLNETISDADKRNGGCAARVYAVNETAATDDTAFVETDAVWVPKTVQCVVEQEVGQREKPLHDQVADDVAKHMADGGWLNGVAADGKE